MGGSRGPVDFLLRAFPAHGTVAAFLAVRADATRATVPGPAVAAFIEVLDPADASPGFTFGAAIVALFEACCCCTPTSSSTALLVTLFTPSLHVYSSPSYRSSPSPARPSKLTTRKLTTTTTTTTTATDVGPRGHGAEDVPRLEEGPRAGLLVQQRRHRLSEMDTKWRPECSAFALVLCHKSPLRICKLRVRQVACKAPQTAAIHAAATPIPGVAHVAVAVPAAAVAIAVAVAVAEAESLVVVVIATDLGGEQDPSSSVGRILGN